MRVWVVVATACTAERTPCAVDLPQIAVVATDYQSGILATSDPSTGATCDALAVVGPDPAIRSWPAEVAVFDRTGGTSLRLYTPGQYARPAVELALEPGLNLHDVLPIDGELWLAPFEGTEVLRLSRAGEHVGTIDLGAYADADGRPEIDRFVATPDGVYVGLQRLNRDEGWTSDFGYVVRLGVDGVEDAWIVGPNAKIYPDPSDPLRVIALTGTFFEPDGALEILDPDEGPSTLLTEETVGYDLSGFAGLGAHAVVLGVDFDLGGPSHLDCVDLGTGVVRSGMLDDGWFVDAVAGSDRVYVASRTGWAGEARDQLLAVDPATCTVEVLTAGFLLDPFGITFVGP